MKDTLQRLLAVLALGCLGLTGVVAQTDVTDYITNPDFEDGATGWKTSGIGPQGNKTFALVHGNMFAETWTGRGGTLRDNHLQQTLTALPLGVYTVTCAAQNIQEDTPTKVQKGAWLFANGCRTAIGVVDDYSVTTTVGDGTLTLGVQLKGCTGNWFAVDNFRLTYTVVADSLQPYVLKMIAEADAVVPEGYAEETAVWQELQAAKALLATYVGSEETEGLTEAAVRLQEAIRAFRFSLASTDNPFDITYAIVNPSFEENGSKGWTAAELGPQGNDSFRLKEGSTYLEKWTWRGNAVGDGSVRQLVADLPSGNYRLSCAAQNIQEDTPTKELTGAWLYAGEKRTAVGKTARYAVEFTCITGETEIGFEAKGAKGNWIAVDDFQLLFLGANDDAIVAQLQARIEAAEACADNYMNADTLVVLTQAIAAAKGYDSAAGTSLAAIALALNKAIRQAEGSIAAYAQLLQGLTAAQGVLDANADGNGRTALVEALAAAQAVYDDLHAGNDTLADAAAALRHAVLVFQFANASGAVPEVTTHPEVIYGCKAAVGRLTVKGSNIMERGFCWSTEPEPTVLDNSSTTYYDFNGQIYLMPDLEPATTYYVRAYAITKTYAVGYGDVVRIITLPAADVVYSYNWAGDDATNERIDNACKTAVSYLNTWTSIRGFRPSVNYDVGDDGAHGSYGGWITIGGGFAQNPGTVMHEMGHGIGVGQHWRYTSWDSPLHPTMYWTGERANRVFKFFENNPSAVADGDRVHVCYGLSGVTAPVDLLRQAAFYQGMYEDGLPAVSDGACPYYSFDCEEGEKYYLTNEKYWGGKRFLAETSAGKLTYRAVEATELVDDDSYGWYISFEPTTGFYHLRNAKTGHYMTYTASSFATRDTATPVRADDIQLMPARKTATITVGTTQTTVKPYWLARGNRAENPEVLEGTATNNPKAVQLDFYDTATKQHWALLPGALIEEIASGIVNVEREEESSLNGDIYDLSGRRVTTPSRGLYIVNGKKVIIK